MLEINSSHPVFQTLCALEESDPEKLAEYAKMLYDQALLIEGMQIEDPGCFFSAGMQPDGGKRITVERNWGRPPKGVSVPVLLLLHFFIVWGAIK